MATRWAKGRLNCGFADYPENTYIAGMVQITSAQLQKNFGLYREKALKEPLTVTHHGRESLVVMSVEEFRRLKSFDDRKAYYPWELPDDIKEALENVDIPEEAAEFDHECK